MNFDYSIDYELNYFNLSNFGLNKVILSNSCFDVNFIDCLIANGSKIGLRDYSKDHLLLLRIVNDLVNSLLDLITITYLVRDWIYVSIPMSVLSPSLSKLSSMFNGDKNSGYWSFFATHNHYSNKHTVDLFTSFSRVGHLK